MKSARILTLVLVLCMVSVCFLSGTVAKYTSTGTGTDTASVAKWKFTVESADIATTDTWTFDLFNTVNNLKVNPSDDADNDDDVNDAADNDADTPQIIAPGTTGSFVIDLVNESEVTAKFGIVFDVDDANNTTGTTIPLLYRVKVGDTWIGGESNWQADLTDFNIDPASTEYDAVLETNAKTTTVTVEWKWVFEAGNDTNDTALGADSVDTPVQLEVSATVTATQVD